MKTIYFIRHGQSEGNKSFSLQQSPHTLLTERGKLQAKTMAKHMARFPLQTIIASPFLRTKATAEALAQETSLPIEFSELFVERRRPSVQINKRKNSPYWLWTQIQLVLFSRGSTYRHSDEETPSELLDRAYQALTFLAARPEDTIAVVTHGIFMRALYSAITLGEGATGRTYLRATRTLSMHNTALMVATYDSEGWKVTAWNVDASKV